MIIGDEKLNLIFNEVAEPVRTSVRQSRDSIIRDSKRRVAKDASDVAAIHVVAAADLCNRRPDSSLSILRKESTTLAGNAIGHRLAGYAYLVQQQMEAAMSHFDQAVRIDPCHCDAWVMMGGIQEKSGQRDLAIAYYKRAVVFDDRTHESTLALSRLYAEHKDIKEAIDTLRISLFRDQRSPQLNLALAKLLQCRANQLRRSKHWRLERRILEEAVRCYQVVMAAAPTADTCIRLGLLQRRLDQHQQAQATFEKAVDLDPTSPSALAHLADSLVENGRLDRALDCFHRSFAADPKRAGAHFRYSRAQRFQPTESTTAYLDQLTELVSQHDRSIRDQVQLNFALAKVLDDLGDYDTAWNHYDRANRMKPRHSSKQHGPANVPLASAVDDAKSVYTREYFDAKRDVGNPSNLPIFIVGMPRSGTTLTEQILSSHPSVTGAGELKEIDRIRQRIVRDQRPSQQQALGPCGSANQSLSCQNVFPKILPSLDDRYLRELADDHLSLLKDRSEGAARVSDKMPTNFLHLGLIAVLFPGATIIHCRRDPMDVLASCYCQNLSVPFCDLEALVGYHRHYRQLMAYWQEVLPLNIHTVDYESLVADPEPNAKEMIKHCGLPWDERCLKFHTNRRAVHTPSKWQVRQPMYSSSVGKWKRFENQLAPIARKIENEIKQKASF